MTTQTTTQAETNTNLQPQGEALGMPYDFRRPTMDKVKARWWNPEGPMLTPKVFGWGWDLNLAHWGSWVFFATVAVLLAVLFRLG